MKAHLVIEHNGVHHWLDATDVACWITSAILAVATVAMWVH